MGVTIHFEGKARSTEDIKQIISIVQDFSISRNLPYYIIDEKKQTLSRVIDGTVVNYEGHVKGVNIEPHYNSERFRLEFGEDLQMSDYCKTQFAPIEVHIAIVELLESIKPYFSVLNIMDEGGYWGTNDLSTLQKERDFVNEEIIKIKNNAENIKGPVRLSNGRIADYIQ